MYMSYTPEVHAITIVVYCYTTHLISQYASDCQYLTGKDYAVDNTIKASVLKLCHITVYVKAYVSLQFTFSLASICSTEVNFMFEMILLGLADPNMVRRLPKCLKEQMK